MTFDISLDLEEQVIRIVVDDAGTITAAKSHGEDGDEITYYRLNKLESEEVQEKIKRVCEILFTLDEE